MELSERNFYQTIYADGQIVKRGARLFQKRIALIDWEDIRGKTVLDLGCNNGVMAVEAAKRGAKYVLGVDNDSCIAMARELADHHTLDNISLLQMDIESENFKNDTPPFDIVFFFAMLNHMKDKKGMLEWIDSHTLSTLYYETNFENKVEKHLPILKAHTTFSSYIHLGESEEVKDNSYHLIKCVRTSS